MYTFFRSLAMWRRAKGDERGATAVEYGLIVALIAAVIVAIVGFLGDEILAAFTEVRDAIRDR